MNTPETINIEKYAEALNNLVGMDIGYLGDSDENVNAMVEVIRAAKQLENRVKELEDEIDELKSEAEWIKQEPWDAREVTTWQCSKCKHVVRDKTKYCANCGSKMKGVK